MGMKQILFGLLLICVGQITMGYQLKRKKTVLEEKVGNEEKAKATEEHVEAKATEEHEHVEAKATEEHEHVEEEVLTELSAEEEVHIDQGLHLIQTLIGHEKLASTNGSLALINKHVAGIDTKHMTAEELEVMNDVFTKFTAACNGLAHAAGDAWQDVKKRVLDFIEEQAKKIKGWAGQAINKLKQMTGFDQCKLSKADFLGPLNQLVPKQGDPKRQQLFDAFRSIKQLEGMTKAHRTIVNNNNAHFAEKSEHQTKCADLWDAIGAIAPFPAILGNHVKTILDKCPPVKQKMDATFGNPAISFGFTASAGFKTGFGPKAEVGGEMGVALDSQGNKYCYYGGCLSGVGVAFPPIPHASLEVGFALTAWTDVGNIPGQSAVASFGPDMDWGAHAGAAVSLVFGCHFGWWAWRHPDDWCGISFSGTVGISTPNIDVGIDFAMCETPLCISTQGCKCGWVRPEGCVNLDADCWKGCGEKSGPCKKAANGKSYCGEDAFGKPKYCCRQSESTFKAVTSLRNWHGYEGNKEGCDGKAGGTEWHKCVAIDDIDRGF